MNFPEIHPYEEQAIDIVVKVINDAKFKLGIRQNLSQLANSRNEYFSNKIKVPLNALVHPLAKTCEKLISDTIEKKWKLNSTFKHILRYIGSSQDESSNCFYYEAIFSQPSAAYPIPQAIAAVYFRVQDKHILHSSYKKVPNLTFRVEGSTTDHDVRIVALTPDWILAVIQMKIRLFKRIEALRMF